jgi:hypothetical protein
MRIIKHPDTYQCEICGFEHTRKSIAEMCEEYVLLPCKVVMGDKVLVESRYDGFLEVTVTDIKLVNNRNANNYRKDFIKLRKQFIPTFLEDYVKDWKFHSWLIITNESIEVCKDGTCSDTWEESEVFKCSEIVWNTNYDEIPSLPSGSYCFIKWVNEKNNEVTIRRGERKWFDEYWKDKVKFVAFSNTFN